MKAKEIFNIEELFDEWKRFLSWCYENNDKTVEIHRDKLKWTMNYITNLQEENERLKKRNKEIYDGFIATQEELSDYATRNEKAIKELYVLKDMIYKPETREENFEVQRKISSIIKVLYNGGDEE